MKRFCKTHSILASLLAAWLPGLAGWLVLIVPGLVRTGASIHETAITVALTPLWGSVIGLLCVYPLVLTGIQLFLLLRRPDGALRMQERIFDAITLFLGVTYSIFYISFSREVCFGADWDAVLSNAQTHTPIETGSALTIAVLALVGLAGYLLLTYVPLQKLPPLIVVLGFAGMYLACGVGILWSVQICRNWTDLWLLLLPLNVVIITARTVRSKMAQWKALPRETVEQQRGLLRLCRLALNQCECWPVLAFLLMWPLLGLLICILVLFGQAPNAVIKAWTETSDWNLSQRVAPQNIYYDEHYLCTVAAGGHEKVVRPIRMGVRHGHAVIVNRQLCVANAFEQVLEERTPRFHKAVRHFYDTCGFPIAKLIHSPYIADAIYFLMKPLEWLFLIVLYAADVHPEDRIAVQYTGKSLKDFM